MRKILLRFDDICPTMDFEQFARAKKELDKCKGKPLLGVIPVCSDSDLQIEKEHADFWEWLKQLQSEGYTVAMHGFHHVFDTEGKAILTQRKLSEFAGHSLDEQRHIIELGKKELEEHGICTDIFFAPAHSYDENTVKALALNGFKYVSDGRSDKPYVWHGVTFLPCSTGVPKMKKDGYYTAVFHAHEWVRADKKQGYDQLVDICSNHANEVVGFNEYIQQPVGDLDEQRSIEKRRLLWEYKIVPMLRKIPGLVWLKHFLLR